TEVEFSCPPVQPRLEYDRFDIGGHFPRRPASPSAGRVVEAVGRYAGQAGVIERCPLGRSEDAQRRGPISCHRSGAWWPMSSAAITLPAWCRSTLAIALAGSLLMWASLPPL